MQHIAGNSGFQSELSSDRKTYMLPFEGTNSQLHELANLGLKQPMKLYLLRCDATRPVAEAFWREARNLNMTGDKQPVRKFFEKKRNADVSKLRMMLGLGLELTRKVRRR